MFVCFFFFFFLPPKEVTVFLQTSFGHHLYSFDLKTNEVLSSFTESLSINVSYVEREEKSIQVIIQGPPQSPNMIKAMDIKSREVTLSWSQPLEPNNSPLLSFVIEYTQANGKKKETIVIVMFNIDLHSMCLSFVVYQY